MKHYFFQVNGIRMPSLLFGKATLRVNDQVFKVKIGSMNEIQLPETNRLLLKLRFPFSVYPAFSFKINTLTHQVDKLNLIVIKREPKLVKLILAKIAFYALPLTVILVTIWQIFRLKNDLLLPFAGFLCLIYLVNGIIQMFDKKSFKLHIYTFENE